jgi:predicted regulator of amino acid metabolism with ACT domain
MDWVKKEFSKPPAKPNGWVSITDIANQTGNNRKTVEARVKKMVDAGQLEVKEFMENNHRVKCYRKKVKK